MSKVKNFKFLVLGFAFCALSFSFITGCQRQRLYKESRIMMGTFVSVKSTDERAAGIAFDEIKRIEGLMSKYKEDSEISQLNKRGRIKAGPDVIYLIKKAKEMWVLSGGAFDITVGPFMDLWGFSDRKYSVPSPARIEAALKITGFDKVIVNEADNSIRFKVPGMKIDLGALAKGYAVDCAVRKLREKGVTSAIVRVGGEIYTLGTKAGRPWVIAIRSTDKKGFAGTLKMVDQAVSTSGGYEQFFIKGGVRYAHIINPKTGMPAKSGVAAVTVIASDCVTADALATAIFVLGEQKGRALAEKFPGAQIKLVIKERQRNEK